MFDINIPYKLVDDSINRFFVSTTINNIESILNPKSKVKTKFDIKKNRIIIRYPSQVSTLQNRVLKTAIAYSKKLNCEILVGVQKKNTKSVLQMNIAHKGSRKYEVEVKDTNMKVLLKNNYTSKKQLMSDLSNIVI